MTLHSSLLPPGSPLPKTVNGKSRADDKRARDRQDARDESACYRFVDARDGYRDRYTGQRVSPRQWTLRLVHHHLIPRSRGGGHDTWNVLTLSQATHDLIHVAGTLRLSGDADARDDKGKFCGVKAERLIEGSRWEVERWI